MPAGGDARNGGHRSRSGSGMLSGQASNRLRSERKRLHDRMVSEATDYPFRRGRRARSPEERAPADLRDACRRHVRCGDRLSRLPRASGCRAPIARSAGGYLRLSPAGRPDVSADGQTGASFAREDPRANSSFEHELRVGIGAERRSRRRPNRRTPAGTV